MVTMAAAGCGSAALGRAIDLIRGLEPARSLGYGWTTGA